MGTIKQFFHSIVIIAYKKSLSIDKRYRFAVSTVILTVLMLFSTFFPFYFWPLFVPIFMIGTYALTYLSILEGIEHSEWFSLFVMPILVTVAFYFFYFLFPGRWLTRIPFILLYGISIYAMLLCSNIFNVGVEKNLQLYRAAFSVNFFYHAITSFFLFNILFSLQQIFLVNVAVSMVVGFVLGLHLFWTIRLNLYWEREVVQYAALVAGILAELALILSFLPLKIPIYALVLAASYYCLTGLIYNYIDQRLFKETIREYLTVLGFVCIIAVLSLNW